MQSFCALPPLLLDRWRLLSTALETCPDVYLFPNEIAPQKHCRLLRANITMANFNGRSAKV
jgi:hypothetical protein